MNNTVWSSTFTSTTIQSNGVGPPPGGPGGPPPGGPGGPGGSGGQVVITSIQKKFGFVWIYFSVSLRIFWSHQHHHYLSSTHTSFSINKLSLHLCHYFKYHVSFGLYLRFSLYWYWPYTCQH